ncbi:MAG: MFS transporter [Alphaproteobacteria bacterium]|nr:MFS transporter [Alphaproteobacteria bacterium]
MDDARATRRRIWGWFFFDFASQPYNTLLLTFIFGPYFATVVGDPVRAQSLWGVALSISGASIALLAPILGAMADGSGRRMPWIVFFSVLYVLCASVLWIAAPGTSQVVPVLVAFGVGLVAMEFATTFTNAMLPDLGPPEEIGRISGSGWAFGYVGGVLALAVMLLFLAENEAGVTLLGRPPILGLDPAAREGTRSVGPFVGLWYAVFMVPFWLWVRDRPGVGPRQSVAAGLRDLRDTLRMLPSSRSLAAYLASSMLYRDALNGMFTFGGIYALGTLDWSVVDIGLFGIVAAISGAVFAFLGGRADSALGPKTVIVGCIAVLLGVAIVLVTISPTSLLGIPLAEGSSLPDIVFFLCGALIGGAGGALQSSSRTMMVRQSHPDRMTQSFGLFALAGKATSFVAPAAIAWVTDATGSQRLGITPLIALFALGLVLLAWVDSEPVTSPGTAPA